MKLNITNIELLTTGIDEPVYLAEGSKYLATFKVIFNSNESMKATMSIVYEGDLSFGIATDIIQERIKHGINDE